MKMAIDVKNKGEGDAIKTALDDPTTRAFVLVMGAVLPLSEAGRRRVLAFVYDKYVTDKGVEP